MTEFCKYQLVDVSSVDFVSIFNFISRLIYCLENDSLNDNYNRRMIKPGLNERDARNIHSWLRVNGLDENNISNIFFINFGSDNSRQVLNVIFIDTDKDRLEYKFVSDYGIFEDSAKYKYVFIPKNFVDYDIKRKIISLQYIFYDILGNGTGNNKNKTMEICELLANLPYDIPDLFDQKLKQYLNTLLEYTGSGANYINFRTDKETISQIVEVIESYLYS